MSVKINISLRPRPIHVLIAVFFCCVLLLPGCGRRRDAAELLASGARELAAGNVEKARALAADAVKYAPASADARILYALVLERANRPQEALAQAAKAIEFAPGSFIAQYTYGRLCAADRAHWYDALVALGKALELHPGDRDTLILLANTNMNLNPAQAQKYLLELARDRALYNTAAFQNQFGICLAKRGSIKAAGQAFLKACRADPAAPVYLYNAAYCLDRYIKQPKAARPLYRQFLELAPDTDENAPLRQFAASRERSLRNAR